MIVKKTIPWRVATFILFVASIGDLGAKPLEMKPEAAVRCESLGKVSAISGYGKNPNWAAYALTYAELRAEKLGATHVQRMASREIGIFNGEVTLEAYRCQNP